MKFTIDIQNPQQQFLQITAEIKATGEETTLFFPTWRPGRYELANFAKNVRKFSVYNSKNEPLAFEKESTSSWIIQSKGCENLIVKYEYYASELNAGSTYLDKEQLYVNPVNCLVFTDEELNDSVEVKLNIPSDWEVAHSLKVENNIFKAKNFDEMADCPFICSPNLQHNTYDVNNVTFHVWFNGIVKPDWERLLIDFEKFTRTQMKYFGGFPVEEYHFLFHILPTRIHHGVEHSRSTVIALGPSYSVFNESYQEFLGVSSHELYHTWNIKALRPKDWQPYDFKRECPSKLGYVAEGVTTYMGDLILLKSGVFSLTEYMNEMNTLLHKHYDNFGRSNYSVAASSYDSWLDGYQAGAPGRKVSIYTEGALLAFIIDVLTLKQTGNKKGLIEVMRKMYDDFGVKGIGFTEHDYKNALEEIGGESLDWYFENYINGTTDYTSKLEECFEYLGFKLNTAPSSNEIEAYLGAKTTTNNEITALYPNGALEEAGVMVGDKLIAINDVLIEQEADRWAEYFRDSNKTITVDRKGRQLELVVPKSSTVYYKRHYVSLSQKPTDDQVKALKIWG